MEAASARMAARDRFGGFDRPATTPLQRYIQNACDPQNYEPNLALDLEIADLINQKKGSAPREAAIAIVTHVNNRNPNISLLALNLLDICVKNCGYPFHLQISTKEFLNELVRRFPERPPMRYSRVQSKILELIEEWRSTICQTSKYKDDLGFVRDMHRLLSYKGYTFPATKREDAAVLNPSESLQSAEEMEEEERNAQSAKLQELIRRGTPHDLQEANRLMKIMAGFDNRSKTDYRAKAAEEVGRVQQKARLLEEMLQNHKPGDENIKADSYEDLAGALGSAHPKIQKMCEEESDDHEAVAKLLEINDSIHRTLQRYRLVKAGDLDGASRIPRGTLGTSGAGVVKGRDNELNLIDLGGNEASQAAGAASGASSTAGTTQGGASLENDLLGLSLGTSGQPSTGGGEISLGGGNLSTLMANYPGSSSSQQQSQLTSQQQQPPVRLSSLNNLTSGPPVSQSTKPNHDPFGLGNLSSGLASAQSAPTQGQKPPSTDPFAVLSSSTTISRSASPFPNQAGLKAPSTPQANLSRTATPSLVGPSAPAARSNGTGAVASAAVDDEWEFASALPDGAHEITVTNTSVNILFAVSRPSSTPGEILVKASVSNNTAQAIQDFTLQIAISKGTQMRLENQSGRNLQPQQRGGITQVIHLIGVEHGKGHAVKVRWRASYWVGPERKEEQGEVASLGIA